MSDNDPADFLVGHAAARAFPGYTPSYMAGRNPIDNPVGDATARLQGQTDDAADLAAKFLPANPLAPVAPQGTPPMKGFADGGSTDDTHRSSLHWLAQKARALGGENTARYVSGVAGQLYGLDPHGNVVFLGTRGNFDDPGTAPALVEQLLSLPTVGASLLDAMPFTSHGRAMDLSPGPEWSQRAAQRLAAIQGKLKGETGVPEAHTLPEHVIDAAAALTSPVAVGKAPRALEAVLPVRPNTLGQFARDSALLGAAGNALGSSGDGAGEALPEVRGQGATEQAISDAALRKAVTGYSHGASEPAPAASGPDELERWLDTLRARSAALQGGE